MELNNLQPKTEKDLLIAMSIDNCIITYNGEELNLNKVEKVYNFEPTCM